MSRLRSNDLIDRISIRIFSIHSFVHTIHKQILEKRTDWTLLRRINENVMNKVNCIIFLSLLLSIHGLGQSVKVGIGISSQVTSLHVKKATSELLQLENSLALGSGGRSDLKFKQGNYPTGVISTIGTGLQTARMG